MIHLEKVNWDSVDDVIKLRVNQEQKGFVAPNRDSIMDAYFAITEENMKVFPFGIYLENRPVGFIMFATNVPWAETYYGLKSEYYYIWRFMIDKKYQGKGYGREAMKQVIELIKTYPAGKTDYCWLSYEPENEIARKLYLSLGFEERIDLYKENMEIPAVLKL